MNERLSEHFTAGEFACHCGCGFGLRPGDVSAALVNLLERVRTHFAAPVHITSGCRCPAHNRAVGGADHSQHTAGIAADITVQGQTPAAVASWLESVFPSSHGIGRYPGWTHIDVRPNKARWGKN